MKKINIILVVIILIITSCNSKHGNMIVKGKIYNFQKGKVFLEKMQDTLLIKVDSMALDGDNEFVLSDNVEDSQVYYISISKSDKYLQFFGEKGIITISDDLKTFGYNPIIKGSKNQKVFDEYKKMKTKFTNLKLDLIKEKIEAIQTNDNIKLEKITKELNNVARRKNLYTLNFVVKHADLELAPFLVLTELPKANKKALDTIQKTLTSQVKNSLYGKKFMAFIAK